MGDTIGQRLLKFIKKTALKLLFSEDMKKRLLADLNLKIDIPFLDEKTEAELFEIMWDYMHGEFKRVLSSEEITEPKD